MTDEATAFIQAVTDGVKPLYTAYTHASWEAATTGTDEANEREKQAQAEQMRFWADRERFELAQRLDEQGHDDPLVARAVRVARLSAAKAQQDEQTIQALTELEAAVRHEYYNFRAEVNGQRLSDNDIDRILTESDSDDEVRETYLASKQIGARVADTVRQLARTRNRAAQAAGHRDHFARSLALNEIDEDFLFDLFDQLEAQTRAPFEQLKAEIDASRAERFGVPVDRLRPWHYGDRFFQRVPAYGEINLEEAFKGRDPVELSLATYDGWGMDVRPVLERSDLYAREGKNQHAFCIDMDRAGDVRTLNNLEPTRRWTTTLLHELGHAVYDEQIDPDLPWLLRKPSHILTTEAIAILTSGAAGEPEWLSSVLGVADDSADQLAAASQAELRAQVLVFTRWVLVMTNFERAMYADPESDLDQLWWELVSHYQLLTPPDRSAPDWAAKYHVALVPVYYQNYELGGLVSEQFRQEMRTDVGAFVGNPEVGSWLKTNVFASGASLPWPEHVEAATGRPLQTTDFVRLVEGTANG